MNVVLASLPIGVKGFCTETSEGHTIVLNSRYTREQNRKTYMHELAHITNEDFCDGVSVSDVEIARHS